MFLTKSGESGKGCKGVIGQKEKRGQNLRLRCNPCKSDQKGTNTHYFMRPPASLTGVFRAGAVRISECSQAGWMEIGEDDGQSAHITCVDIPANATVRWEVSVGTASQGSATCGPTGRNCTHRGANLAASRPSDTSSVLTIVDNLRTKVGNGSVSCIAVNLQPNEFISCKINVVSKFECVVGWGLSLIHI